MPVDPSIRTTGAPAPMRGDVVQPTLMVNPYAGTERAGEFENGYEFAQSVPPEEARARLALLAGGDATGPSPVWREGFQRACQDAGLVASAVKAAAGPAADEDPSALPALAGAGLAGLGGLAYHDLGAVQKRLQDWHHDSKQRLENVGGAEGRPLTFATNTHALKGYIEGGRRLAGTRVLGVPAGKLFPVVRRAAEGVELSPETREHYRLYTDPGVSQAEIESHHLRDYALPQNAGPELSDPAVFPPEAKAIVAEPAASPADIHAKLVAGGHTPAAHVVERAWNGGDLNGRQLAPEAARVIGSRRDFKPVDEYLHKIGPPLSTLRRGAALGGLAGAGLAAYGLHNLMRKDDDMKHAAAPTPSTDDDSRTLGQDLALGGAGLAGLGALGHAAAGGFNLRKYNPFSNKYRIGMEGSSFTNQSGAAEPAMAEAAAKLRAEGLDIEVPQTQGKRAPGIDTMRDDATIHVGQPQGPGAGANRFPLATEVSRLSKPVYRLHTDLGGASVLNKPNEYGLGNRGMAGIDDDKRYTRHITPGSDLIGEASPTKGRGGQLPDLDPGNIAVRDEFHKTRFNPGGHGDVPTALVSAGGGWQLPMVLHDSAAPGMWGPQGEHTLAQKTPDGGVHQGIDLSRRNILDDIDAAMREKHGDNFKIKIHTGELPAHLPTSAIWGQIDAERAKGRFRNVELVPRTATPSKDFATADYHFLTPGSTAAEYMTMHGNPGRIVAMVPPILGDSSPTHHFETNADVLAKHFPDVHKVHLADHERAAKIRAAIMADAPARPEGHVADLAGRRPDWRAPLRTMAGDIRTQRWKNLGIGAGLAGLAGLGAYYGLRDRKES